MRIPLQKKNIGCDLISQRYELSECDITNNECKLNINNVYSYSECANSNLTRFYSQMVTLSQSDIINVTNSNVTKEKNESYYNYIPNYIYNIVIDDSDKSSKGCSMSNLIAFKFTHQCDDSIQFSDDATNYTGTILACLIAAFWIVCCCYTPTNLGLDRCFSYAHFF